MVTVSSPLNRRAGRILAAGLLALLTWLPAMAQDMLTLDVRAHDTLIGISARYLEQPARWPELQRLNRIANPRRLKPGSTLRIPLDWLRWSELPMEIEFVHGVVSGRQGPLKAGMRLQQGDSLDTGAQGSLTVRFADGAIAVFAPNTRAVLAASRVTPGGSIRATRIDLQSGSVDTSATPLKEPASRFEVRTPRVVTAVRGTHFRVAAENEVSRHEVLTGSVVLTGAAAAPLPLTPGEGLRAQAGQLGAVVRLLPAPDLRLLPAVVERTTQVVQVAPQPGAAGWRWQIAADMQFTRLLQDARTNTPAWVLSGLPDGDYFLRVRAADAQQIEGIDATHALAVRARPEPPLQIAPPAGASVASGATLRWAEMPDAGGYHVQLARDPAFSDLVLDRTGIQGGTLQLDAALPPATYHWRLATLRANGTRGPFGDAGAFTVLEPSVVAPPQMAEGKMRLAWSGPASFPHQVQMASDIGFAALILDNTVPGASLELNAPEPGVYFVRTRVVLPDASVAPWSAAQRFEIPKPPEPPKPPLWPWLLLFLLPLL